MVGPMRELAFRLRFRYSCDSGWEINSASSRRAELDPFWLKMGPVPASNSYAYPPQIDHYVGS